MSHIHKIKDAETHFIIDATTREISNAGKLPALAQGDHNSEVFTFEAPRFVDGHDLTTCNKVKVHYLNIESKTRKPYADIYEVEDLHIDETDETKVVCTWLISKYATQYEGLLNFAIHFNCETDGVIDYSWKTAAFTGITVKGSVDSTEQIMTEYTDILEKWKQDVVEELTGSAGLTEEQEADLAANTEARHEHSNKDVLDKFKVLGKQDPFYNSADVNDLKYGNGSLRFASEGAVVSRITPIEKDGAKFLRLTLDWGNEMQFEVNDDVVDIPVSDVNKFTEQSGGITLNGSELDFGFGGDIPEGGVYVGSGDMPDNCNVQIDPSGDVVTIPTKVSELENDSGFITNLKLNEAVESVLTEAKESGEFDGADGQNGKDGVSATHSWNDTTLIVTSASGTSSANLKGEKGDQGIQGLKGDKGDKGDTGTSITHSWHGTILNITSASGTTSADLKGDKGSDGYSPIKGTDYFTEADKTEMINDFAPDFIEMVSKKVDTFHAAIDNSSFQYVKGSADFTYEQVINTENCQIEVSVANEKIYLKKQEFKNINPPDPNAGRYVGFSNIIRVAGEMAELFMFVYDPENLPTDHANQEALKNWGDYQYCVSSYQPIVMGNFLDTDISVERNNNTNAPSTKAVGDYTDKQCGVVMDYMQTTFAQNIMALVANTYGPHIIYNDPTGFEASNDNAGDTWHLTGLNLSPYKRIKCYVCAAGDSDANYSPEHIVEVHLDDRAKGSFGYLSASHTGHNPNNRNRCHIATFTVNAEKTAIQFQHSISMYGTSATNSTGGRRCYLIEGYMV